MKEKILDRIEELRQERKNMYLEMEHTRYNDAEAVFMRRLDALADNAKATGKLWLMLDIVKQLPMTDDGVIWR